MTRLSSSFVFDRDLVLIEARVVGPTGRATEAQLVLDTGAAVTTLTPKLLERIGYTEHDGYRSAKVRTAVGEEHGYWLRVAELTTLGVTTPRFALTVFPLGHQDIDGLIGMNFLRYFNLELRPVERQVIVELLEHLRA